MTITFKDLSIGAVFKFAPLSDGRQWDFLQYRKVGTRLYVRADAPADVPGAYRIGSTRAQVIAASAADARILAPSDVHVCAVLAGHAAIAE